MTNAEPLTLVSPNGNGSSMLTQVRRVIICAGTGCMANGAMKVFEQFKREMADTGLHVLLELRPEAVSDEVRLSKSGCQGFCQMGPLVSVLPDGILYTKVRSEDVAEIVHQTLVAGQAVERLLYKDPSTRKSCRGIEDNPFYSRQNRLVLKECGYLDPEDIHEYILHGGYQAARKAFVEMSPQEICKLILDSGLRGRGGDGRHGCDDRAGGAADAVVISRVGIGLGIGIEGRSFDSEPCADGGEDRKTEAGYALRRSGGWREDDRDDGAGRGELSGGGRGALSVAGWRGDDAGRG